MTVLTVPPAHGPATPGTEHPPGHPADQCAPGCPHTHSAAEAAQMIGGITSRTLLNKAGRREIPSTLVGSEVRFTDEQIAEIIAAGERRPATRYRRDSRRRS